MKQCSESKKLAEMLCSFSPFVNKDQNSYPTNRYTLKRNIAGFAFSEKVHPKDASLITNKFTNSLRSYYPNGTCFAAKDLYEDSFRLLFEHLFIANVDSIMSEGAIFLDPTNDVICLIHLDNHLTVFMHDRKNANVDILGKLSELDNFLQESITFAFSTKYGYITSSVLDLGTALTIEAMIHAPAINYLKKDIPKNEKVQTFGLHGEKDVLHNLLILSNKYSLGISEKNNYKFVNELSEKVKELEHMQREHLLTKEKEVVENVIAKNFGVLQYCKFLSFHESLELASMLDFGISLGFIESKEPSLFFDLFFSLRRAHLETYYSDKKISIEEKRANFLKEKTADLKLVI